jgi:hypothetical protein
LRNHIIERSGRLVLVHPETIPFAEAQISYMHAIRMYNMARVAAEEANALVSTLKGRIERTDRNDPAWDALQATLIREEDRSLWANAAFEAHTRLLDIAQQDYEQTGAPLDQHGNPVADPGHF